MGHRYRDGGLSKVERYWSDLEVDGKGGSEGVRLIIFSFVLSLLFLTDLTFQMRHRPMTDMQLSTLPRKV